MGNKMGQLNCLEDTKNTGFGSCFLDWEQIQGAFIFDRPRTFSKAEVDALLATLEAAATADSKSARMFPVHNFVGPTDSSEAVVVETFDYGGKRIVRDGDNDWTFKFAIGGACLLNSIRTHNGPRWVLFYDKKNKLMGYNKLGDFATIPLQFIYGDTFKLATGSAGSGYSVRFVMLSKYTNEQVAFVKAGFDLSEVTGLEDIDIVVNSFNQDTGVANVTLQTDCGATNVYDQYSAQIVGASFTAYDEDGNVVAISSVAGVAGNKTFNITLAVGYLPDNGDVTLQGAPISVLVTQGIIGYEIGKATLTVVGS